MSDTPLSPDDQKRIRALGEEHWTRAFLAQDYDRLLALCSDDIVYMPADHPPIVGRTALKAWLATFPPLAKFEQPIHAIDGHGDMAVARATFAVALTGEDPATATGKALCSLRRQADGQWLITSVCWNFDATAPPALQP